MNPVDPRVDPALVPRGSRATVIAEKQNEYADLPSIRTPNAQVVTRWELTPAERDAVARGEDIYITLITTGAINPMKVTVGPMNWKLCPLCNEEKTHAGWCPLGR